MLSTIRPVYHHATTLRVGATLALLSFLTVPVSAQIVGGRPETLYTFDGAAAIDQLGQSVAGAGDVNQDGFDDVIVGAELADPGGVNVAGSAYVSGHDPFLIPSTLEVSAGLGEIITYQLRFPIEVANANYILMISASGRGPFEISGLQIPLTLDFVVAHTFFYDIGSPVGQSGFRASLNGEGNATAFLQFPPGFLSGLIGFEFQFAAIAYQPGFLPELSSAARPLKVVF